MQTIFCAVDTKDAALDICPWAAEVVAVDGGFLCFASVDDFRIWNNQI
jgi:hypothetical protein